MISGPTVRFTPGRSIRLLKASMHETDTELTAALVSIVSEIEPEINVAPLRFRPEMQSPVVRPPSNRCSKPSKASARYYPMR